MRRSYICLLLLAIFSIQASCAISHNFLNLVASKNGEAKIAHDENGLYVEMDIRDEIIGPEDSPKMLISFVTPDTLLADKGCLGFDAYDCSSHICNPSSEEEDVIYPYFTAKAQKAKIEGYLDRKAWALNASAHYSTNCETGSKIANYGKGRLGIIGMGIEDATANYLMNNTDKTYFSVTLNNLTSGSIYFSTQKSLASSKAITLKTKTSWRAKEGVFSWYLPGGKVEIEGNFEVSVMVDVHADAIGLPNLMYKPLLNAFKKYGIDCKADDETTTNIINKPECAFTGNVTDLPTLNLQFQGQNISIPKEIYLKDAVTPKQEKVTLNFRELYEMHDGENYIHPTFENTIILGSHFLTQYYAVFKQDSMEFYKKGESPSSESSIWKWIGLGVVVIAVAAGVFLFMKKKNKSQSSGGNDGYTRN